jgi:hypothetical protein
MAVPLLWELRAAAEQEAEARLLAPPVLSRILSPLLFPLRFALWFERTQ